jgi:hypothetical protein
MGDERAVFRLNEDDGSVRPPVSGIKVANA